MQSETKYKLGFKKTNHSHSLNEKLFLILPLQCLKLHHIQLKFHTQGDTLSQGEHCQQPRSTNKMLSVLKINNEITNKNKTKQKIKKNLLGLS